jgi:hypothetical protein
VESLYQLLRSRSSEVIKEVTKQWMKEAVAAQLISDLKILSPLVKKYAKRRRCFCEGMKRRTKNAQKTPTTFVTKHPNN